MTYLYVYNSFMNNLYNGDHSYRYKIDKSFNEDYFKIDEIVRTFSHTIEKSIPYELLTNYYRNIDKLQIVKGQSCFLGANSDYKTKKNTIRVSELDKLNVHHELMHMASCDGKTCGFGIRGKNNRLLLSLTEGYTQLLTERYFGNQDKPSSYILEVTISKLLEEIIGKDKMYNIFFKTNGTLLVYELLKYEKIMDVFDFISNTDYLTNELYNASNKSYHIIEQKIQNVINFLISLYINKKNEELDNNKTSFKEYINGISSFINKIPENIEYNKNVINIKNTDKITNIVYENFTKNSISVTIKHR